MGLMDKVKAQANQLAQKTQEAAQEGKAKIDQAQANRRGDALLRQLGAAVFAERTGRGTPDSQAKIDQLISDISAHERENGLNLTSPTPNVPPPGTPGSTPNPFSGPAGSQFPPAGSPRTRARRSRRRVAEPTPGSRSRRQARASSRHPATPSPAVRAASRRKADAAGSRRRAPVDSAAGVLRGGPRLASSTARGRARLRAGQRGRDDRVPADTEHQPDASQARRRRAALRPASTWPAAERQQPDPTDTRSGSGSRCAPASSGPPCAR